VRRAQAESGLGESASARIAHGQRDPEVRHHRLPVVEQDICRLDIAVDDPLPVGVVQRARHVRRDVHRFVHGKLLQAVDPVAERLSLYVRHHVEEEGIRLARVEQRQNVRVLKIGGRLDLGEKTLGADDGAQFGFQDLDRDLAVVPQVIRQVDGGHAALTELSLDAVAAVEGRVEAMDRIVGHGQNRESIESGLR
jgi:hypothetical protein